VKTAIFVIYTDRLRFIWRRDVEIRKISHVSGFLFDSTSLGNVEPKAKQSLFPLKKRGF
jgi:hypothetical protein